MTSNTSKKVLIIAPQFKSIPSNGGGVEGLITDLIAENEIQKKCNFFVISKYSGYQIESEFTNTKIIYSEKFVKFKKHLQKKYYFNWLIQCFFRKLVRNRIGMKLFKNSKYLNFDDNYFGYFCLREALKIKPDSIVIFGYDKIHHFWQLVRRKGNNDIFYHLHYCRAEDRASRNLIPNTIAVSKYVLDKWITKPFPYERSTSLNIGVDFKKFHYGFDTITIKKKRHEMGFDDNSFVVIFVGRFRPGKGVVELLNAFNLISDNNIKLLMVGYFDRKSEEEKEYEDKVRNAIQSNKNIFYSGFVPNHQLSLYYSCANVQVVPTVYEEAAGLVTIEGMLAGLPLIITKSGGMPEYVDDDCSFKLDIDRDLSKNIASSILKLKDNPELCREMGSLSKKCASKFSITQYYNNLLSFLFKK